MSVFTPVTPVIVYTVGNAWAVLVSKSTLPVDGINTSWLHLNNQEGGGGGGSPYPIYLIYPDAAETTTLTDAETTTTTDANTTTET